MTSNGHERWGMGSPEARHSLLTTTSKLTTRRVAEGAGRKDLLSTIKQTAPARLYLNTLRRFALFKSLDIFLWQWGGARLLILIHKKIALRMSLRRYPYGTRLTALAENPDTSSRLRTKILEQETVSVARPVIYPVERAYQLPPFLFENRFPPVNVNKITNAWVYGGSNLTFTREKVFCHDLYNFTVDYTSEELHGRHLYQKRTGSLFVILRDPNPDHLPSAAACLDACAHNYAHFLTEVLPRIALFCSLHQYSDIPLIIDDQLHENILEAVACVVGPSRTVYLLPLGRAIKCDTLYIISATGYVPFDQRNKRLENLRQGQFSSTALQTLRSIITTNHAQTDAVVSMPEKIYVQRNSSVRKLINASQVEEILCHHGFALIDPGKLSFHEQVDLFSHAKIVIGPTGAAMANAIFCQPGTDVGILMSMHKHMIYKYWSAMLSPLNIHVSYLLGTIVANQSRGIHGDYRVDETILTHFLNESENR